MNSARIEYEFNPDERWKADLKHGISGKVPVREKVKLKEAAGKYMNKLEQTPVRVRSDFGDPRVAYAA